MVNLLDLAYGAKARNNNVQTNTNQNAGLNSLGYGGQAQAMKPLASIGYSSGTDDPGQGNKNEYGDDPEVVKKKRYKAIYKNVMSQMTDLDEDLKYKRLIHTQAGKKDFEKTSEFKTIMKQYQDLNSIFNTLPKDAMTYPD